MTRVASSEPPLLEGLLPLHLAVARDIRKSAEIVFPAALRLKSASDASERLAFPCPTVLAWATSAPFSAPTLPSEIGGTSRSEVSWAPPVEDSGPVSPTVIGESGGTVACTTYACPLKAVMEDVCAVPAGAAKNPISAASVTLRQGRDVFSCAMDATILCSLPRGRSDGCRQHRAPRRRRHLPRLTTDLTALRSAKVEQEESWVSSGSKIGAVAEASRPPSTDVHQPRDRLSIRDRPRRTSRSGEGSGVGADAVAYRLGADFLSHSQLSSVAQSEIFCGVIMPA